MSEITLNERLKWPDICKGFAIILVVIGHSIGYVSSSSECTQGLEISALLAIDKWIYSFHMALFFFVSGYLQSLSEKRSGGAENTKRKILSIIGPYIVFSIIFWLFKIIFSRSISNPVSIKDLLLIGVYPLSDLWFLYVLAIFYILRVILVRTKIDERAFFFLTIAISIAAMSFEWSGIINKTALPRACKYLNMYFGGAMFQRINKKSIDDKKFLILSFVLVMIGLIGLFLSNECTGVIRALIDFIVAWCNVCAFVIAGSFLESIPLQFLGMKSLYVFLAHDYAVCAVVIITRNFINSPSVMTISATVGGFLFSIFVIWICRKVKVIDYLFKPQLLLRHQ